MRLLLPAAFAYFAVVFAAAFVLGALRVTLISPQVGALVAVALEVPVVLVIAWGVAGWVLRRWPSDMRQRALIGAIAFGLLMVAELALAVFVFAQAPGEYFAAMATLPGAVGLAGQIGFAAVPALRT